MHFSALVGAFALSAAGVSAQVGTTVKVTVGADGKLGFNPKNITAAVGTQVEFSFYPKNHTVTQSSFANPCHPLAGGFFSGFVPTVNSPSGTTFTITVNDSKPVWFFCGQTTGNHCQSGMVGAINAPAVGNTLNAFIALAQNASTSTSPPGGAVGGVLAVSNSPSSTVTSSTTSSISISSSSSSTSAASQTKSTIISSTTTPSTSASTTPTHASAASSLNTNLLMVMATLFGAMAIL